MNYANLSWKEIESLPKDTLFFLTIGPMEAHGPHLPLSTDFLIAKKVEEKVIKILEERNEKCFSLPSLPIGTCKYLKDFPGTISISWKILYKMLVNIFKELSKNDFKYVIICNFHMDFFHLKAIHKAIKKARKFGLIACEPISIYYFKGELFEKMEGEIHADIKETSLALYLFPEKVKDYKIKDFKIKIGLFNALKNFKEIASEAYIGSPSKASPEYGKKLFEKIVSKCLEAINILRDGKKLEMPFKLKILLEI